jgi:hypothetical protein
MGFGFITVCIECLQLVTINNYNTFSNLHTPQIPITNTKSSLPSWYWRITLVILTFMLTPNHQLWASTHKPRLTDLLLNCYCWPSTAKWYLVLIASLMTVCYCVTVLVDFRTNSWSAKLLLVLTNTETVGLGPHWKPWPPFFFFKLLGNLKWGALSMRGRIWPLLVMLSFTRGDSSGYSLTDWFSPAHAHANGWTCAWTERERHTHKHTHARTHVQTETDRL